MMMRNIDKNIAVLGSVNHRFHQTMRWFGPQDPVKLSDLKQAGCDGVVSALHTIPNGEIWSPDAIKHRKTEIEKTGMTWSVVESLPIHESIKLQTAGFERYLENYKTNIQNLAECGVKVVTYNFMPVLDWTRTDLNFKVADGSIALRFETAALAAFDLFILKRSSAKVAYPIHVVKHAKDLFSRMGKDAEKQLTMNIVAGLPGSEEGFSLHQFRQALMPYGKFGRKDLQQNLIHFLKQVIPIAEECGVKMAIHPDDPPYPILGLPRVVSTMEDISMIANAVPSTNNGLCFCTGSLGVNPANDLIEMIKRFSDRIHFVHLRNIRRNSYGDFYEDNHLEGEVDMFAVIKELIQVMQQQNCSIPVRPDHGHQMMDDIIKKINPGYSGIGRMRGLAEIRGLELGIIRSMTPSIL